MKSQPLMLLSLRFYKAMAANIKNQISETGRKYFLPNLFLCLSSCCFFVRLMYEGYVALTANTQSETIVLRY